MSSKTFVAVAVTMAAVLVFSPVHARAQAEPAPTSTVQTPTVIKSPVWIQKPTGSQIADVFPRPALEGGIAGETNMLCHVKRGGVLTDCEVVMETPAGAGFGQASLELARRFRLDKSADGTPLEGSVVYVPIRWQAMR